MQRPREEEKTRENANTICRRRNHNRRSHLSSKDECGEGTGAKIRTPQILFVYFASSRGWISNALLSLIFFCVARVRAVETAVGSSGLHGSTQACLVGGRRFGSGSQRTQGRRAVPHPRRPALASGRHHLHLVPQPCSQAHPPFPAYP